MIRRSLTLLTAAAMALGFCVVYNVSTAIADTPQFTNIGVQVSNGAATYYLCFKGSGPPGLGAVNVTDSAGNQYQAAMSYNKQTCSGATAYTLYQVTATFVGLPPGGYTFRDAVAQSPDGYPVGLTPGYSFMPNGSGYTVGTMCFTGFNVSPDSPTGLQPCLNYSGAVGIFNGPPPPPPSNTPIPTNTPTATATPTNTPIPTNTPTQQTGGQPTPTATTGGGGGGGQASPTPTAPAGGGGGGQASPTPTAPSDGGGGGQSSPTATATLAPISIVISSSPGDTSGGSPSASQSPAAGSGNPGADTTATAGGGSNGGGSSQSGGGSSQSGGGSSQSGGGTSHNSQPGTAGSSPPTKNHGKQTVSKTKTTKHAKGPTRTPTLHVTVLTLSAQPGGSERIAVTYSPNALVQASVTFAGLRPISLVNVTNAHGRLTLTVHVPANVRLVNGHASATVRVRATAGAWHTLSTLSPTVQPGAAEHFVFSAPVHASLRTLVTFPGLAPLSFFGATGGNNLYILSLAVPRHLKTRNGKAVAKVTISALTPRHHAVATAALNVSDLVVSVAGGSIVNCEQTQTVRVSYHPNVPLRILVMFTNGLQLVLNAQTNGKGTAVMPVKLTYVKADNPVHIVIAAVEAIPHGRSLGQTYLSVSLPSACQKSSDASVTIGS